MTHGDRRELWFCLLALALSAPIEMSILELSTRIPQDTRFRVLDEAPSWLMDQIFAAIEHSKMISDRVKARILPARLAGPPPPN